ILKNLARMRWRGQTRRAAREEAAAAEVSPASPEALLAGLEEQRRLAELIVALDEEQRHAILMCYGEGLRSSEAGKRLGVPAGTVRWRVKLAIEELRRRLGVAPPPARRRLLGLAGVWRGIAIMKTGKVGVGVLVLILLGLLGVIVGSGALRGAPV